MHSPFNDDAALPLPLTCSVSSLASRSLRISSVPLMTLMRYADADGQDWSPLVAEVMAHMTWSEYVRADSKKGTTAGACVCGTVGEARMRECIGGGVRSVDERGERGALAWC